MRPVKAFIAGTLAAAVLAVAAPPPLRAQDIRIAAFYGTWTGSGIAQSSDSIFFGVTVRDLDVRIAPTGDGFSLAWTTVLRQGGDPDNPDVRRRSTAVDFVPTARPNVYQGKQSREPLLGGTYSWARLADSTLTVYMLNIDADGVYDMLRYARTLTGTGMDLSFSRIRDGAPTRTVNAKLVKQLD